MYTFSISCNFLATFFTLGLTLSSSVYPFGGPISFRPLVYVDLADCFAFGISGLKTDALLLYGAPCDLRLLLMSYATFSELRRTLWATPHPFCGLHRSTSLVHFFSVESNQDGPTSGNWPRGQGYLTTDRRFIHWTTPTITMPRYPNAVCFFITI